MQPGEYSREVVGLIPAGGEATRLAPLPLSKELFPIGFRRVNDQWGIRPKPVCLYLLESLRLAGIENAFVVLRRGKWDLPAYLGDGRAFGLNLAYLMLGLPYGVPYTLDQAYPFVRHSLVAVGFPDVIFQPADAFVKLLDRQAATGAEVVLGLFPTDQPQKADMVEVGDDGRVYRIEIKPEQTHLRYTWMIAVWTPTFTQFMHEYLKTSQAAASETGAPPPGAAERELYLGDIVQQAIAENLLVESVCFHHGACLDIGTPDDLVRAVYDKTNLPVKTDNSSAP